MRALTLATASVLLLTMVPVGSALLPDECVDANETASIGFMWTPKCLRIVSGDIVTFQNADPVTHNARSSQDDLFVLRLLGPACFATPNFAAGVDAHVRFVHDSNGVSASLRKNDGSWAPANDCDLAVDPVLSTATQASIPFECGLHQSMTGRIVVGMVGGGSG